jgi:hypothetical protein
MVDHNKTLGSALYAASAFQAFLNHPRTEVANFFLLNDMSVMGWIADRSGKFPPVPDWTPTARFMALQLYSRHFGQKLLALQSQSPQFRSEGAGLTDAVPDIPSLDSVASLDLSGGRMYLIVINRNLEDAVEADVKLDGFTPLPKASVITFNGRGIDSHTGTTPMPVPGVPWARPAEDPKDRRILSGAPNEVWLDQKPFENAASSFAYTFPAHSITAFEFTRGSGRGPGRGKRE